MNETDLLHAFMAAVPYALPQCRVFRRNIINRVVVVDGRKVPFRSGQPGQGDAYALVQGGRHIEIETKASDGRMKAAQVRWRSWCRLWRIPHLVLRAGKAEAPTDTVTRWVDELRTVVEAK